MKNHFELVGIDFRISMFITIIHIANRESEGRYCNPMMFHWEPEEGYHCKHHWIVVPFWLSADDELYIFSACDVLPFFHDNSLVETIQLVSLFFSQSVFNPLSLFPTSLYFKVDGSEKLHIYQIIKTSPGFLSSYLPKLVFVPQCLFSLATYWLVYCLVWNGSRTIIESVLQRRWGHLGGFYINFMTYRGSFIFKCFKKSDNVACLFICHFFQHW